MAPYPGPLCSLVQWGADCQPAKYACCNSRNKPEKSGEWRKYHSQKFLDCAEISQHKHNITKDIYLFPQISGFFLEFFALWKSCSENYNKTKGNFY